MTTCPPEVRRRVDAPCLALQQRIGEDHVVGLQGRVSRMLPPIPPLLGRASQYHPARCGGTGLTRSWLLVASAQKISNVHWPCPWKRRCGALDRYVRVENLSAYPLEDIAVEPQFVLFNQDTLVFQPDGK